METKPHSRAVRVNGEVVVLHCWACGTAHRVDPELCVPGELIHMVCSNSNCRMSMFLDDELAVDDTTSKHTTKRGLNVCEMKTNKPTTELWTVLAMVNVLALIYPFNLLFRAESFDEN